MMLTMQIGLILAGVLMAAGAVQWIVVKSRNTRQGYLLDYVEVAAREEQERIAREQMWKKEEDERQAARSFGLDFLITHGSAFGGCAATCTDGRSRRGVVALEEIMMYGRHPSGKDFTYYIEDQGLLICACDDPDALLVKSTGQPFEIREAGLGRDQGISVQSARIEKNMLYYIILESRHEISIRATRKC